MTCNNSWLNNKTSEVYQCVKEHSHFDCHEDKDGHIWYTDGKSATAEFSE